LVVQRERKPAESGDQHGRQNKDRRHFAGLYVRIHHRSERRCDEDGGCDEDGVVFGRGNALEHIVSEHEDDDRTQINEYLSRTGLGLWRGTLFGHEASDCLALRALSRYRRQTGGEMRINGVILAVMLAGCAAGATAHTSTVRAEPPSMQEILD